jgi:hypothetical protein
MVLRNSAGGFIGGRRAIGGELGEKMSTPRRLQDYQRSVNQYERLLLAHWSGVGFNPFDPSKLIWVAAWENGMLVLALIGGRWRVLGDWSFVYAMPAARCLIPMGITPKNEARIDPQ